MRRLIRFIVNVLLFIVLCVAVAVAGLALLGRTDLLTMARLRELITTGQLRDYEFSWKTPYRAGVFLGSLITGLIIGAVPLIVGALKNKLGIGFLGLLACIVAALIGGLIIGMPLMGIFIWWISREAEHDRIHESKTALSQIKNRTS